MHQPRSEPILGPAMRSPPAFLDSRPAARPEAYSTAFQPAFEVRPVRPAALDSSSAAQRVACLPPVTLCQQSAASFGRRRLSSNALCRLAPRPVIGRPPHIAAGRPPPGGPVRSTGKNSRSSRDTSALRAFVHYGKNGIVLKQTAVPSKSVRGP